MIGPTSRPLGPLTDTKPWKSQHAGLTDGRAAPRPGMRNCAGCASTPLSLFSRPPALPRKAKRTMGRKFPRSFSVTDVKIKSLSCC